MLSRIEQMSSSRNTISPSGQQFCKRMRADVILRHPRILLPQPQCGNANNWKMSPLEAKKNPGHIAWAPERGIFLLPAGFPHTTSSVLSKARMTKQVPRGKQALQKENDAVWEKHLTYGLGFAFNAQFVTCTGAEQTYLLLHGFPTARGMSLPRPR